MPKRVTKTTTTVTTSPVPKKKKTRKSSSKATTVKKATGVSELEETLIKNLVELQKIHTDLAEKFDRLSREISQILALFEVTAKNFAKNVPMGEYEKDKDFLDKIDTLLNQNKTLAKGLVLMEERLRERMYGPQKAPGESNQTGEEQYKPSMSPRGRPLPRF
jgi:hypothetical protein